VDSHIAFRDYLHTHVINPMISQPIKYLLKYLVLVITYKYSGNKLSMIYIARVYW
jgi:hypothetical protein